MKWTSGLINGYVFTSDFVIIIFMFWYKREEEWFRARQILLTYVKLAHWADVRTKNNYLKATNDIIYYIFLIIGS